MQHRAPTEQGGPDMPFGLALGFFLGPRAQDVSLTPGFMYSSGQNFFHCAFLIDNFWNLVNFSMLIFVTDHLFKLSN